MKWKGLDIQLIWEVPGSYMSYIDIVFIINLIMLWCYHCNWQFIACQHIHRHSSCNLPITYLVTLCMNYYYATVSVEWKGQGIRQVALTYVLLPTLFSHSLSCWSLTACTIWRSGVPYRLKSKSCIQRYVLLLVVFIIVIFDSHNKVNTLYIHAWWLTYQSISFDVAIASHDAFIKFDGNMFHLRLK